jgi:hypothetical protein
MNGDHDAPQGPNGGTAIDGLIDGLRASLREAVLLGEYSPGAIAQACGLHKNTLHNFVNDNRDPSIATVRRLQQFLRQEQPRIAARKAFETRLTRLSFGPLPPS